MKLSKVYFIRAKGVGAIKVGFTSDLKGRFQNLKGASPVDLEILTSFSGTLEDEKAIHDILADHRLHGEWFKESAVIAFLKVVEDERKPEEWFQGAMKRAF